MIAADDDRKLAGEGMPDFIGQVPAQPGNRPVAPPPSAAGCNSVRPQSTRG
jgi:hypothetical protein